SACATRSGVGIDSAPGLAGGTCAPAPASGSGTSTPAFWSWARRCAAFSTRSMGRLSGSARGQEQEGESGAVRRDQTADPAGKEQRGAPPHHTQTVRGKDADHAEQRALRHLAQGTSVTKGRTRLAHQPTRREAGKKRHRDERPEQQRPVRRDRVRRNARRIDEPELRNAGIFELSGQAGRLTPRDEALVLALLDAVIPVELRELHVDLGQSLGRGAQLVVACLVFT